MTQLPPYLTHVLNAMMQVDEITYRRIFNGVGIYHRGVQFAIVLHDKLYFRANEESRHLFLMQGMTSFQPSVASQESDFYQLPDKLLDAPEELKYWMRIAVEAAHSGFFLDDLEEFATLPLFHHSA